MKFWYIGCGTLLLIAIILVVFLVNQFQEISAKIEKVAEQYMDLDRAHPFDKTSRTAVTIEQVQRFNGVRKQVLIALNLWVQKMEEEDRSGLSIFFDAITDMIPTIGASHVEALGASAMSPAEYYWILNKFRLALRYAESPEAPPRLKELRAALDEVRSQNKMFDSNDKNDILPQIDPSEINLPLETITAFTENSEHLKDTMHLLIFFDEAFREFYPEMAKGSARAEDK